MIDSEGRYIREEKKRKIQRRYRPQIDPDKVIHIPGKNIKEDFYDENVPKRVAVYVREPSTESVDILPGGDGALYVYKSMLEQGTTETGWVSAEEDTSERLHSEILDVERDGLKVSVPDKSVFWQVNASEAGWYRVTNGETKCFAAIGVDTVTDEGYLAANRLQSPDDSITQHIATEYVSDSEAGNSIALRYRFPDFDVTVDDEVIPDIPMEIRSATWLSGAEPVHKSIIECVGELVIETGNIFYLPTLGFRMVPGEGIYVKGDLLPRQTATNNLGSSSLKWNYIYSNHSLQTSDRREKKDIEDIGDPEKFVMGLRPRRYRMRQDDGKTHMGFIAQEVAEAMPEGFGGYDGSDPEHLALAYVEFIAPLVAVVQRRQRRIEELERIIARMTNDGR